MTNEIFHVYNRGVEKRLIFIDDEDRFRFIHDLYEFNDSNPAPNLYYKMSQLKTYEVELRKRKPLVSILAFCMMPNHFHILLEAEVENGITEFMRKIGTGYTNYFNKKYERVGSLFQGRYKIKYLKEFSHYEYLPYYIHLNPLNLIMPDWKKDGIRKKDIEKALLFLEEYRWSSYPDYIKKKNFPSLINSKRICAYFGQSKNYKFQIGNFLRDLDSYDEALTKLNFVKSS